MSTKKDPITAALIARCLLKVAADNGKSLTNKKLQKLLYYTQAWHLAFKKEALFEEQIEAWVHGPAVRSVYQKYKSYGSLAITHYEKVDLGKVDDFARDLILEIWRIYGKYDGDYLEELTHREQPWLEARGNLEEHENSSNVISHEIMENFYKEKLEKAKRK